jgi:hypothetical protein
MGYETAEGPTAHDLVKTGKTYILTGSDVLTAI